MAYLPYRQKRLLFQLFAAVLVAGVLFFFRSWVFQSLSVVLRPFSSAGTWVSDKTAIISNQALLAELAEVKDQRNAFVVDYAELATLKDENAQLREQLSFIDRSEVESVTARVISRSAVGDTLLIDQGREDGLREGLPVIVDRGILIGKLSDVQLTTATVTLTTSPSLATAASVLNETRTLGIANGLSGNLLSLNFIPQEERLQVNDLIVTSGIEEFVPAGLIIGVVNKVESSVSDPFQEAIVEPLINADRRHIVTVLLGPTL